MTDPHQPDQEFVSHLEWQVRTALRRDQRFSEPVHSGSGGRMQIAALILASALIGAGGVVVKDQVQEARQQELLLAEVAAEERVMAMQLELVRDRLDESERLRQAGTISEEEVRNARLQMRQVELQLAKLQRNEEEIRLSGKAPDDGLSAPRLGGRDFVTERLTLEASLVSEQWTVAQAQLHRARELLNAGVVREEEVTLTELAIQGLDTQLQNLATRMDLRRQVLAGTLSGPEAVRQVDLAQVRGELAMLEPTREQVLASVRRAEELVSAGVVQPSELGAARMQLMELESRMEILRLKLRLLQEGEGDG